MANICTCGSGFENVAILAVCQGRELSELIGGLRKVPIGDLPRETLSALLRRLETGEVTDGRDLLTLEALSTGLESILAREIVDITTEPCSLGYEDGELWGLREVPLYSDRGESARCVYEHLQRFLELRQRLIDMTNARHLTARLLR